MTCAVPASEWGDLATLARGRGIRSNFWLGGEELDCINSTPTILVNFIECIACK